MGTIHRTGCVLCAQNCGLEVEVENNRIVKVRGDKSNVRSEGYVCRKGMNIANHQHNADRLKYPLKRVGDKFEGSRGSSHRRDRGSPGDRRPVRPPFLRLHGGGGQCHFERLRRPLLRGSDALPLQRHAGVLRHVLINGRMHGRQTLFAEIDAEETDYPRLRLERDAEPPDHRPCGTSCDRQDPTILVVIDRASETPRSLTSISPSARGRTPCSCGHDAIILQEGWENGDYIAHHLRPDAVRDLFADFDARAAVRTCNLDFDTVREVCRQFATRKSCLRYDLGLLMNRHSAVSSYLAVMLQAICGRIGVRGGNVFHGQMMPLGSHSDERDPKTWRTVATNFFPVLGCFPPNAMPLVILSDHPERLRRCSCPGRIPCAPSRTRRPTSRPSNAWTSDGEPP